MPSIESRKRREFVTSRLRLRDFDYSSPGYYFVTICCQNRMPLFGDVQDGEMHLNEPGEVVAALWDELPESFRGVSIADHIVMPNHIHALIGIGVRVSDPDDRASLTDVIQWYKSKSTTLYIQGVKAHGWPRFEGRLWQQRFHDHVVRNDRDLERIREYIRTNPQRWTEDTFYS